jgi:hypothetical protein
MKGKIPLRAIYLRADASNAAKAACAGETGQKKGATLAHSYLSDSRKAGSVTP